MGMFSPDENGWVPEEEVEALRERVRRLEAVVAVAREMTEAGEPSDLRNELSRALDALDALDAPIAPKVIAPDPLDGLTPEQRMAAYATTVRVPRRERTAADDLADRMVSGIQRAAAEIHAGIWRDAMKHGE